MTILLDSASLEDISRATALGFVRGITTNPTLLRKETDDPLGHAVRILRAAEVPEFYYQPTGAYGSLREEAERAFRLDPARVVLKLPATPEGAALAGTMVRQGARVALTAVQSPQAMIVAEAIGCVAVIPYVDRALRDLRSARRLVAALAEIRRRRETRIVAASIKNVGQFADAFCDGADAVTAPLAVLEALLSHPAALEADQQFAGEYGKPRA
jgi:transaldolase